MANLTPTPGGFNANVYRLEVTDQALGGESGPLNVQAKQLIANDLALKAVTDTVPGINTRVGALETSTGGLDTRIDLLELRKGSAKDVLPHTSSPILLTKEDTGKGVMVETIQQLQLPSAAQCTAQGFVNGDRYFILCNSVRGQVFRFDGVIQYDGNAVSDIYMSRGESLDAWYYNNNFYAYKHTQPQKGGIIGGQVVWGHTVAPDFDSTGYMLCDGRTLVRADYPELFTIIGNQYFAFPDGATFRINNSPGFAIKAR